MSNENISSFLALEENVLLQQKLEQYLTIITVDSKDLESFVLCVVNDFFFSYERITRLTNLQQTVTKIKKDKT